LQRTQHAATLRSAMQRDTTRCNAARSVATHHGALQRCATGCSVTPHVAAQRNTLQRKRASRRANANRPCLERPRPCRRTGRSPAAAAARRQRTNCISNAALPRAVGGAGLCCNAFHCDATRCTLL
jgi:hypothetical protein